MTHGKPSADLIRSLQPAPNGIALPSYERIKAGKYDGPPLHYTAVTARKGMMMMIRGIWRPGLNCSRTRTILDSWL